MIQTKYSGESTHDKNLKKTPAKVKNRGRNTNANDMDLDTRNELTTSDIGRIDTSTRKLSMIGLNNVRKNKILIIGDEFGKNCTQILQILFSLLDNSKYSIESFVKPNACVAELADDIFTKVKDYGSCDFVVFMFDEKNVVHVKYLNILLKHIFPLGKFTNVLLVTRYYGVARYNDYSKIICDTIKKFCKLNKNLSLSYVSQIKLKNDRKCKINACHKLKKYITSDDCRSIVNNIVLKTVDVMSNTAIAQCIDNSGSDLCTNNSIKTIDLNVDDVMSNAAIDQCIDTSGSHLCTDNSFKTVDSNCSFSDRQTAATSEENIFLYPCLSEIQFTD